MTPVAAFPLVLALAFLAPPASEGHYIDGLDHLDRGMPAEALADFRAAVAADPSGPFAAAALRKIAEILLDRGDEAGHARALFAAARRDHGAAGQRSALDLARFLAARGLSGDAARAYAALLDFPREEGRAEALAYLERAGDSGPLDPASTPRLTGHDLDRIAEILARRSALDRPFASADATLHAEILDLLETAPREARRQARRFLDLYPASAFEPAVRFELARLEEREGNFGTALNLYRTAKAASGDAALRRACDRRLGFILRRLGRAAEARDHLSAAGEALAAALLSAELGRHGEACDALERILAAADLNPPRTRGEAAALLPSFLPRLDRVDLDRAPTLDPAIRRQASRAAAHLAAGEFGTAETLFRRTLALQPTHDGARLGLFFARLLAGDDGELLETISPLLDRHATDEGLLGLACLAARLSGSAAVRLRALLAYAGRHAPAFAADLARLRAEGFRP